VLKQDHEYMPKPEEVEALPRIKKKINCLNLSAKRKRVDSPLAEVKVICEMEGLLPEAGSKIQSYTTDERVTFVDCKFDYEKERIMGALLVLCVKRYRNALRIKKELQQICIGYEFEVQPINRS